MDNKLLYIKTIAEEKSVSKAAVRMCLTQPYMSKILREVEIQYGITLFDRKTTPISLTPAGERFIKYIEDVERLEDKLANDLRALSMQKRIPISIGVSPIRGSSLIPIILNDVKNFINVDLSFFEGYLTPILEKIISKEIMFGISLRNICTDSSLVYEDVFNDKLYLILPPNSPWGTEEARGAYKTPPKFNYQDLAKLKKLNLITFTEVMELRKPVDRFCAEHNLDLCQKIQLKNVPTFVELVASGQGYSFVPFYAIAASAHRKDIFCYALEETYMQLDYVICWHKDTVIDEKLRIFKDAIKRAWKEV